MRSLEEIKKKNLEALESGSGVMKDMGPWSPMPASHALFWGVWIGFVLGALFVVFIDLAGGSLG